MPRAATELVPDVIRREENGHKSSNGKQPNRVTKALPDDGPDAGELRRLHPVQPSAPLMRPERELTLMPARLDPHLVSVHEHEPRAAAEFNRLAIAMLANAAKQPNLRRILVASAHHAEGRTCVTLNMAAALARTRKRVVVVDTDLQRPSVSRLLGIDSEIGLVEALTHNLGLHQAVTRLNPVDFHVLLTRSQVENPAELLSSVAFSKLVHELEANYDFVLFDSAPLLASSDATLLELHTDATLLVVRPQHTSASEMGRAIGQLAEEKLLGVVLNRTKN